MSAADVQALLRFLTKDAKVPLATALGKVKELQSAQLGSTEEIAKSNLEHIKSMFPEEKVAKQILGAAKRTSKKRTSDAAATTTTIVPAKRRKADPFETPDTMPAAEEEAALEFPSTNASLEELETMVFITNRAPLVLAFAATLLKFTMPEQPPSSRLSLAQAVVSLGAQSKAKSIGLATGASAEDEGWGKGQPVIQVMGRDISVLKRWGYEWKKESVVETNTKNESQQTEAEKNPAFWGIDLEKLKQLNGPLTFSNTSADTAGLPVYSPQAAHGYVLRSFDTAPTSEQPVVPPQKAKKKTNAAAAAEREVNVAGLIRSLELLFESWAEIVDPVDLDKRAWSWYVHVRPEVEYGPSGWGAKGPLRLADILGLRRKP